MSRLFRVPESEEPGHNWLLSRGCCLRASCRAGFEHGLRASRAHAEPTLACTMVLRTLHVAEKPSVAKSIAKALSNSPNPQAIQGHSQYNRIYPVTSEVGERGKPPRPSDLRVTSVTGHLMELEFTSSHRTWGSCKPVDLFDAPVEKTVPEDKKNLERQLKARMMM